MRVGGVVKELQEVMEENWGVVEEEWRAATQSLKRRGVVILFTPGSKHSCKPIISPASQFSFIEGYFLLQST